jgi:SagB-type dehydrogenase family enzyme
MNTIPHDYYIKFLDKNVLDEVNDFHAKTNYIIHERVEHLSYLHRFSDDTLRIMAGNELRLYPDMDLTVKNEIFSSLPLHQDLRREESCEKFKEIDISFEKIKKLLSPIARTDESSHKRGYPSAGALYPVEIFICSLSQKNNDWPCDEKVLHVLAKSRQFEILQKSNDIATLRKALLPPGSDIGSPNLAVIYAAYLPKVLFKYRYRGYRMAQMEVGSLYMLIDLAAKDVELKNRIWSGYCDNMISKTLGLNPTLFHPLCVQFIGGTV